MKKILEFLSKNFHFFGGKVFNIFKETCFRNEKYLVVIDTPLI